MTRTPAKKRELRAAVDRLPLATRQAMLEGVDTNPIVVGADGDPRGGVCPIYATPTPPSRRIGRPFARAWDRYAGARLPRRASERELGTLRSMLQTSIDREHERERGEPEAVSLRAAIVAHKASQKRSRALAVDPRPTPARADSGERDRTAELSRRHGWAWLRPFRNYDDYEQALQALDQLAREAEPRVAREDGAAGGEPRRPLAMASDRA